MWNYNMVRPAYYDRHGIKKGAWSVDEDLKLKSHIDRFGHRNWRMVPILAGLARCGKSCRLRWMNYLKPGLRRGNFTKLEEDLIIFLHADLGNKWSAIAAYLPGRTDNEVKNQWHAHLKKRISRQYRTAWMPPPEQSSNQTSLSCITSTDDDQETEIFSTGTNSEPMNLVSQIPPHFYSQVDDQIFIPHGATNQVYLNDNMLQFEDNDGQLYYCDESMNYFSGYDSDITGITSTFAESLHPQEIIFGEEYGQCYVTSYFGSD